MRAFSQVDVFSSVACRGNPLAVVLDAEGLDDETMTAFAAWTNLSETTFVVPVTEPGADYRVRIFTPSAELPFAGHPTLGTCHAWLEAGNIPARDGEIVQQCAAGLVRLRQDEGRVSFAAPPLSRSGSVDTDSLRRACSVLGITPGDVVAAQWCDNGPGWLAVMLRDADQLLDLQPDYGRATGTGVGLVGPHPLGVVAPLEGGDAAIEVRAFFRSGNSGTEDPVTGSLQAALAQWLLGTGTLQAPYVASQGTAMGRAGRVHVHEVDGEIWVGGATRTVVSGTIDL